MKNDLVKEIEKIEKELPLQLINNEDGRYTWPDRWERVKELLQSKHLLILEEGEVKEILDASGYMGKRRLPIIKMEHVSDELKQKIIDQLEEGK